MEEHEYADEIACESCTDGVVLYAKSGWQCNHCMKWACEGCCDQGWYDDWDQFYCINCKKEAKKNSSKAAQMRRIVIFYSACAKKK
jgi:hypothetical protein